jgi:hypothetical protein
MTVYTGSRRTISAIAIALLALIRSLLGSLESFQPRVLVERVGDYV